MSPTGVRKFSDVALVRPAGNPIEPALVGGGKKSLPGSVHMYFELLDVRRFGNGVVHLHYRTRT